jgi:hypothetical protein
VGRGIRGSRRRRALHQEPERDASPRPRSARRGSSSAPQIAQPAAKALTRSPQLGQTWGPVELRIVLTPFATGRWRSSVRRR